MVITKEMIIDIINLTDFVHEKGFEGMLLAKHPENQEKFQTILKPKMEEFKTKWGANPAIILNSFLKEYSKKNSLEENFTSKGLGLVGQRLKAEIWACISHKNIPNLKPREIAVAKSPQLWISICNSTLIFGFAYGFNMDDNDEKIQSIKNNDRIIQNIITCFENDKELNIIPHDGVPNKDQPVLNLENLKKYWSKNIAILKIFSKENLPEDIEEKITETFDDLLEVLTSTPHPDRKNDPNYWQITLGEDATKWDEWKKNNIIAIYFKEMIQSAGEKILEMPDDEIKKLYGDAYPENPNSEKETDNIINFLQKMKEGHFVLIDQGGSVLGWGIIKSGPKYGYSQEFSVYRQIEWKNTAMQEPVTEGNRE